jgi:hypothetical protein
MRRFVALSSTTNTGNVRLVSQAAESRTEHLLDRDQRKVTLRSSRNSYGMQQVFPRVVTQQDAAELKLMLLLE